MIVLCWLVIVFWVAYVHLGLHAEPTHILLNMGFHDFFLIIAAMREIGD